MAIVDDLSKDPKFLDLSPEAKRIVLTKKDPAFGRLSKQAQEIVIDRLHAVAPLSKNPEANSLAEQAAARRQFVLGTARNLGKVLSVGAKLTRFGSMMGGPGLAAGGEVAAEAMENMTGEREGYSPAKIASSALISKLPFVGKSAVGTGIRGAVLGPVSSTIDHIAEGKEGLPTTGQLAVSTITGALFGAGVHKGIEKFTPYMSMVRSAVGEITPPWISGAVHDILFGDKIPPNVSQSVKDEVNEVRQQIKLPGMNKSMVKGPPNAFRARSGKFATAKGQTDIPGFHFDDILSMPEHRGVGEGQGGFDFSRQPMSEVPKGTESPRAALYVGIPTNWFNKVEEAEPQLPVYTEVLQPVDKANRQHKAYIDKTLESVYEHYHGRDLAGREKIQAGLEHDSTRVAEALDFTTKDHMAVSNVRQAWTRLFKAHGLEDGGAGEGKLRVDEFLTEHWPKLRRSATKLGTEASPAEVIADAFPVEVPRSVEYFQDLYDRGRVNFNDTDSLRLFNAHLDHASYTTFLKEPLDAAAAKYVNGKNVPGEVKDTVNHFLAQVRGGNDTTGRDLAQFTRHLVSKASRGKIKLTKQESKNINDAIINSQYGYTIGLRPGPIVHNLLQTLQTGMSEVGPMHWAIGIKRALTPGAMTAEGVRAAGGIRQAQLAGVTAGEGGLARHVNELIGDISPGRVGKTVARARDLVKKSLIPYGSLDTFNRAAMYHAQMSRVESAIRKAKGNPEIFIDHAWLDSNVFHAAERQRMQTLARQGSMYHAGHESALAIADNTQWPYREGMRPPVTTGTAGRAYGAFYSWGAFYANYIKRIVAPGGGNRTKDAVRFARFMAANAAIGTVAVGYGMHYGIKDPFKRFLAWNLLSPAIATGSPAVQMTVSGAQAANEMAEGKFGGPKAKEFGRSLAPIYSPYVAQDFLHLMGKRTTSKPPFIENDPSYQGLPEAVGRVSGILPRLAP